jgi:galactarate dehydratase
LPGCSKSSTRPGALRGVARTGEIEQEADDAEIPISTLRNISFNPNFGGGTMVVSLGCEKLQPERLLPAGVVRGRSAAGAPDYDLVTLQDPAHVGFDAMVGSIMQTAEQHLEILDRACRR